jgi:hypothetical protein
MNKRVHIDPNSLFGRVVLVLCTQVCMSAFPALCSAADQESNAERSLPRPQANASATETNRNDSGRLFQPNIENGGAAIRLSKILATDKPTLLFIHSWHCGPCRQAAPKVKQLALRKRNIKVVSVLVDRNSDSGIDWNSAASNQFHASSLPLYVIYNKNGRVRMKGDSAEDQVDRWMRSVGIIP